MAEGLVGGSLVGGLHNDCLPPGVPAPEEQDHLTCLHNLSHLGIWKQNSVSAIFVRCQWRMVVDNHNDDK